MFKIGTFTITFNGKKIKRVVYKHALCGLICKISKVWCKVDSNNNIYSYLAYSQTLYAKGAHKQEIKM